MARFIGFILFLILSGSLHAQKVALVLSGGASKGIAHAGVIKALEENNIPIDYIVGTSMGSVIGGCYAAGFSANKIDSLLTSGNFQSWISGDIHLENNYYFNTEESGPTWINLDFSVDSLLSSSINSTLASDLAINYVMAEQFAQQSAIAQYNFDNLYVPFRAVASDIFTQKSETIKRGSLGSAIRASFSAPQFYRPIKVNNKYLFDGGIYNNFPVDVAIKEFKPDVVIGVNVSDKIFEEYPYSIDDDLIKDALVYAVLDKSEPNSIDSSGIYIQPDMSAYSSINFKNPVPMIDSGYVSTMRKMDEIKAKIKRRTNGTDLNNERKEFKNNQKPLVFKALEMHNFTERQKIFIRGAFKFKKRDSLTLEDIKRGYYRLVSEEYFKTVYPEFIYDENIEGYVLHLYGRPSNTFKVQLGGLVASRNVGHVYLGLRHYRFNNFFTKTYLNLYTSGFHKSVQFNTRFLLPTPKAIYLEPETRYNNWNYTLVNELFLKDKAASIYNLTDRKYGGNIGVPIGKQYQLILSSHIINNKNHYSNKNVLVSTDTLDEQSIIGLRGSVSFSTNTLNRPMYASSGKYIGISFDAFKFKEGYVAGSTSIVSNLQNKMHEWYRLKLTNEQYFKLNSKYSVGYLMEVNISKDLRFSNFKGTIVNTPAFYPLQDSRTFLNEDLRAFNYAAVGLRNVVNISKNLNARLEGYYFKPLNKIISDENQQTIIKEFDVQDSYFASSLSLVYHTPIGPLAINGNYYNSTTKGFGFFAHFGYILFSNTSME